MQTVKTLPDYHTHTHFSCDSDATVEAMCQAALDLGMSEIALTDHVDFEPLDECCGYFRPAPYWEAILRCRTAFAGKLTIRAGIEVGESHIYAQELAPLLATYEYDVVLGALHWVDGRLVLVASFFDGWSLEEGLARYWDELARLAAEGTYDVLAHLDIVRRAVTQRFGHQTLDLQPYEATVRSILRTVAERGKGIEVNTSYVHKGIGDPSPTVQVLRWFREVGGRIVTLGSDGHRPEHVGTAFTQAWSMVREAGFEGVTRFEKRLPRFRRW